MHQGKLLEKALKDKGITQERATELMGFRSRTSFTRYFTMESLKPHFIEKVVRELKIDASIFESKYDNLQEPKAEYLSGNRSMAFAMPTNLNNCMEKLLNAQQKVIEVQDYLIVEKERTYELQQRLLNFIENRG